MANDQTPQQLGDYAILGVLGAGGMGRVYKVRNMITDRVEAMKVLLAELEGHEEVAARFLREIKLLAGLNHPNIASLHTALTINNQLVMIMEFVEGFALSSRLAQGPLPVAEAINYMDQALGALSYAHQQKIIHRDIKPANMMVTSGGVVKLMDFGIARTDNEPSKLTAAGTTLGSINYMSPEQVRGASVDERSDLYSIGVSLYEMVTGEKPFHGDSNFSIMAAHINQPPTPPMQLQPGLPEGLNQIILTALAKSADDRFQSADAFRNAVRNVMKQIAQDDQKTRVVAPGQMPPAPSRPAAPTASSPARPISPAPTPAPMTATAASAPARATVAAPTPAIAAMPVAAVPAKSGNRGLYMALGALVVLAALVAAGLYLPGRGKSSVSADTSKTAAAEETKPAETPKAEAPAETPVTQTETTTGQNETPVASSTPGPERTEAAPPAMKQFASKATKTVTQPGAGAAAPPPQAPAVDAAELDAIEHEVDQLTARAASVNNSLDHLAAQQAGSGFGLRGDMAGKQASMKVNLAKAQDAIEHNDAARAKRYLGMATADCEALEKFLGR